MKNKGFTLIELLVVIAIIGILAATVLASLSNARGKANDAKVKAQLSNMRAAAESYYSDNSNAYAATTQNDCQAEMFADTTSGMNALVDGTTGSVCGASTTAWAVAAPLSSGNWCVDSTGASREIATIITAGTTVCP